MPPADDWPWDRYRAILLAQARMLMLRLDSHLKSQCDPSGLVQETLTRAFKGLPGYRGGPTDIERLGWMRKILQNYTIEWIRKETNAGANGRIERLIGEALDDSLNRLADFAAKQSSPSQRAERNEEIARLCAALQLLRKEERLVIELHALEGLSIKETCLRLALKSPKAAAGLYARGLVHLRKVLGSDE